MARKHTLENRLAGAVQRSADALVHFESAAKALEAARDSHTAIAVEAKAEIARLTSIAAEAEQSANDSQRVVLKVRNLIA